MPNASSAERKGERLRLIVTAGHNRAPQAVALCQLLARDGHEIAAILVVNPLGLKRVQSVVRKGGVAALKSAARKFIGRKPRSPADAATPLDDLFVAEHLQRTDLKTWARNQRVAHRVVDSLNDTEAIAIVRGSASDGILFCGGGLLRQPFLDAAGGNVLNAHLGPLPEIRGMNAVEWSLLQGLIPTVTIHFIDVGVDTGPVVAATHFKRASGDTIDVLRERSIVAAIGALREHVGAVARARPADDTDPARHRQYFTLATPLRALLEERLEQEAVEC